MIRSFDHPTLEEGEGVTVEAEEGSLGESRSEESDAMAEQECFFWANAMPNKPVCKVFEATATPGARITSMAGGAERRGGERGIRYYSSSAGALAGEVFTEGRLRCRTPDPTKGGGARRVRRVDAETAEGQERRTG